MTVVNERGLPLKLDRITEGKGNCFPLAVIDQCKRPEILTDLPASTKKIIKQDKNNGQMQLRNAVRIFIKKSRHPSALKFKAEYQSTLALTNNESWDEYWVKMVQNKVWADYIFIQSTAWFLHHDIMIVNTTNNDDNPMIFISGNLNDENIPCNGAIFTIGSKSNSHYQSLLPIETFHMKSEPEASKVHQEKPQNSTKNGATDQQGCRRFTYTTEDSELEFKITPNGHTLCYKCRIPFKRILQHISRSPECRQDINIDELKHQFAFFNNTTLADRKAKSRLLQAQTNPEQLKATQRSHQAKSRQAKAQTNPEQLKAAEIKRQTKSRQTKAQTNPEELKAAAVKWQTKSRQTKAQTNPEELKAAEVKRQTKSRQTKAQTNPEEL